ALSLFHVLLSGLGDAGDAVWLWQNGTDGTGEGELERALHTSSRHLPGGHNRTEHPYIAEVLAHPFLGLGFGDSARLLVGVQGQSFRGALVLGVEGDTRLDIDVITFRAVAEQGDGVTDLAFDSHVGDQTLTGFGIGSGHTSSVGVAIGVTVTHVEEEDEVVFAGGVQVGVYGFGAHGSRVLFCALRGLEWVTRCRGSAESRRRRCPWPL